MGGLQPSTPEMGPYSVETRMESFNLTAPRERLTNTETTWSIPAEDVPCVLAALDLVTGPTHNWYSTWEAEGRKHTGDKPMRGDHYPASVDGQLVTLSGPAYLYTRESDWPYNLIELGYDTVVPLRDALQKVAR